MGSENATSDLNAVDVPPELKQSIDKYWKAFCSPVAAGRAEISLEKAYKQLHPESQERETLRVFSKRRRDWVMKQTSGWVASATIQSPPEINGEVATAVMLLKFIGSDPLHPSAAGPDVTVMMTLKRHSGQWTVASVTEKEISEE